jgi:hypothetical protein
MMRRSRRERAARSSMNDEACAVSHTSITGPSLMRLCSPLFLFLEPFVCSEDVLLAAPEPTGPNAFVCPSLSIQERGSIGDPRPRPTIAPPSRCG